MVFFSVAMGKELIRFCETLESVNNPFCVDARVKSNEKGPDAGKVRLKAKLVQDMHENSIFTGASTNMIQTKFELVLVSIPDTIFPLTVTDQETFNFFSEMGILPSYSDSKSN